MNGILTEDINWNTLMRISSNKQKSSELIKLPLQARRNQEAGGGRAAAPQILTKVDLLPIENDS